LFGMRWMPAALHTGQRVGRRDDPETSPISSSVGDSEAVRKPRRQNAAVQIAPPGFGENGVALTVIHVPLGF
jgi:hypothetical protein